MNILRICRKLQKNSVGSFANSCVWICLRERVALNEIRSQGSPTIVILLTGMQVLFQNTHILFPIYLILFTGAPPVFACQFARYTNNFQMQITVPLPFKNAS